MSELGLTEPLVLAALVFSLGIGGVLLQRNILRLLIAIEVMLNGAGLAFVAAGARWQQPDGQVMFVFLLAMTAVEVSVGLALVLQIYHRLRTLDVDELSRMRG
jgi:NADH-quinone oxidoreductase subunit K